MNDKREESMFESLETLEGAVYVKCLHDGPCQPRSLRYCNVFSGEQEGWKLMMLAVHVIII